MTGFGRSEVTGKDNLKFCAEVSSINRKQLEIRVSMPGDFSCYELDVRSIAAQYFSRGAVSVRISIKNADSRNSNIILPDADKFDALIRYVSDARKRNNLSGDVNVEALLSVPGVLQNSMPDADDSENKQLLIDCVSAACADCRVSRETEGVSLKEDFTRRLAMLEENLEKITKHLPEIVAAGKTRLLEKISELKTGIDMEDSAFLREVVYLTDKSDVTEEVVRLKSHFCQFKNYLASDAPCGRNLDFLAQEMFREINTLGNKSGNSSISPIVVVFKTELEKIREQIQNVE